MNKLFWWLPNALTLANLLCGSIAVKFAFQGDFKTVFFLILLAAVFDFLDGFVARLLSAYSPIGGDLDSLADMVSFGFAPSVIAYNLINNSLATQQSLSHFWFIQWVPYIGFLLVLFAALRLARFNVQDSHSGDFNGLATPAMAMFWISMGVVFGEIQDYISGWMGLVVLVGLFSFLMVSKIQMLSLKFSNYSFKANYSKYLLILFSVLAVIFLGYYSLMVVVVSYVMFSIVQKLCSGSNVSQ